MNSRLVGKELKFERIKELSYDKYPVVSKVKILWAEDTSPDLSYLKHELDYENEKVISSECYTDKDIEEYGFEKVKEWVMEDANRLEDYYNDEWWVQVVRAVAEIHLPMHQSGQSPHFLLVDIPTGGLWGIESDADDDTRKGHEEVELATLKKALEVLGAKGWDEVMRE